MRKNSSTMHRGKSFRKRIRNGTVHGYDYDVRGRLEHDRVETLAAGVNGSVRRITGTYDALDRLLTVASWSSKTPNSGSVVNEVKYTYGEFGVIEKIEQEVDGVVDSNTPVVDYVWSTPSDGTTGLRRTSVSRPTSSTTSVTIHRCLQLWNGRHA